MQWILIFWVVSSRPSYVSPFSCDYQQRTPSVLKKRSYSNFEAENSSYCSSVHATIGDPSADFSQTVGIDAAKSLSTTHIAFYGGGIFFYHQAGVINFLRERYDLSTCTFSGASAGALTATLTAADIDFYEATDLALKMAEDAGVWDRKRGLQGIWGPLIEKWLDSLLPNSIDALQDRITLLVTPVPSFGKTKVSRFENRDDLIKCNMASVHLVSSDGKRVKN